MVCDFPECDSHRRMEEIEKELLEAERRTAEEARKLLDAVHDQISYLSGGSREEEVRPFLTPDILRLAPWLHPVSESASKKAAVRSAWRDFDDTRRELSEKTDAHSDYARAVEKGYYRMVPRSI